MANELDGDIPWLLETVTDMTVTLVPYVTYAQFNMQSSKDRLSMLHYISLFYDQKHVYENTGKTRDFPQNHQMLEKFHVRRS